MKGQLLLKALGGTTQAALLSGMGAGGSLLLTEEPKKVIEVGDFKDTGRIVREHKSKGYWSYYLKFPSASFSVNCSGTGNDEGNCTRQIESKFENENIQVYLNEVPENEKSLPKTAYLIYKFTYKSDLEEGEKVYFGECLKEKIEEATNKCADTNLPEGWTKEKVSE